MTAITVRVNGEPRQLDAGATVATLVTALDLGPAPFAVEVNRELVPRSLHPGRVLHQDDAVVIVTFVGGG